MTELAKWNTVLKVGDVVEVWTEGKGFNYMRHHLRIAEADIEHGFVPLYRLPDLEDPTDNQQQAAALYWKLYMDIKEYRAAAEYDYATSFCSNCPGRGGDRGVCCKEDGSYEDDSSYGDAPDYETALEPLLRLLQMFAGKKALEDARAKITL
ncbi:MAG: hypothetical protein J0M33_23900 [Anaerolineae bacterium]|nr:hypothetical protein [Anaerolineae bacterium]